MSQYTFSFSEACEPGCVGGPAELIAPGRLAGETAEEREREGGVPG